MESGLRSIGGVGSIVWILRSNGTWWPGKILATEDLPPSHSPKTGTPIKLVGNEDAVVDWYNLENSKCVKAFRCVEFDDCIERAKSLQGMLSKTREKCTRREDAILHALELEKELLRKQGKLDRPNDASKSSGSAKMGCESQPSWENDQTMPRKRRLQDFEIKTACVKQELASNDALYVDDTQSTPSRVPSMERIMHVNGGEQMGCDSQAKRSRCKDLPPESFDVSDYKKTSPNQIEISSSQFRKCDSYFSPDYFIGGKISEFMEVVESGFSESTSSESESESDSSETEPEIHEDITSHPARGGKMGPGRRERELNNPRQLECDYSSEDEVIRSSKANKESHVPRRKIKTKKSISGRFGEAMQNKTVAPRVGQSISSEGTARALERASEFRSGHPFFKVVITTSFLRIGTPLYFNARSQLNLEISDISIIVASMINLGSKNSAINLKDLHTTLHQSIPRSFCDAHIEGLSEYATLLFKGKSWPLRMRPCSDRTGRFAAGWHAFVGENKLQAGDVCVFEMMEKTDMVLKVSIFRDGLTLG